jgi:predicted outer membrane repeat protein
LIDVTFSGNSAGYGGGMSNYISAPILKYVIFSKNTSVWDGGGMYNQQSSSPFLVKVTFSDNSANNGGGMQNTSSSPHLINVTFSGNTAALDGGGMSNYDYYSTPTLENVTFANNAADQDGGGLSNAFFSSPILSNVTFSGNSAGVYGGGVYNNEGSDPTLVNATFSENSAGESGGGLYNESYTFPVLTNSILWGDVPQEISNGDAPGEVSVSYSDVWMSDGSVYPGTGNLDIDPLLDPLSENGGYVLTYALDPVSPAIDSGNPDPATCPPTDARAKFRPSDGDGDGVWRCDMGAYEFQLIPLPHLYMPVVVR